MFHCQRQLKIDPPSYSLFIFNGLMMPADQLALRQPHPDRCQETPWQLSKLSPELPNYYLD